RPLCCSSSSLLVFLFRHPATPAPYPLSLHDALPIYSRDRAHGVDQLVGVGGVPCGRGDVDAEPVVAGGGDVEPGDQSAAALDDADRKSTRLNSSHVKISYAVFCLKKKKQDKHHD